MRIRTFVIEPPPAVNTADTDHADPAVDGPGAALPHDQQDPIDAAQPGPLVYAVRTDPPPDCVLMDFKDDASTYAELRGRVSRRAAGLAAAAERTGARHVAYLGLSGASFVEHLCRTQGDAQDWIIAGKAAIFAIVDAFVGKI